MSEPSVLIVEDSQQIRAEIKRVLGEAVPDVELYEAETGVEALKIVVQNPPDVILCDVQMPQMDGFQFLRMFRSRPEHQGVPVIMLTSRDNSDEKIYGLDAGATDYLTKPFVAGELVARVRVQLKLKALQDELRTANEKLRELSHTDFLTKTFNRRHFNDVLESEFRRSQRYKISMSVAILDLDHFKRINDTHGHQTGDAVLVDFATLVRGALRVNDVVARFGGEEFAVLLPHTALDPARIAVEKVRALVVEQSFGKLERGKVTFSCGIATYPSETVDTTEILLKRADDALYKAKHAGRNRTVIDAE